MTAPDNLPARVQPATFTLANAVDGNHAAPPQLEEEKSGGLSIRRLLHAVLRHKWLVLGLAVVGTAGSAFAIRYMNLRYVAEATIWIEVPSRDDQMRSPIQSSGLLQNEAWIELLRSFTVLDYVVREQRLYLDHDPRDADIMRGFQVNEAAFSPGEYVLEIASEGTLQLRTKSGMAVEAAAAGDSIGRRLGFLWQPRVRAGKKRSVNFQVLTPREASRKLNAKLETRMPKGGNFMRIGYAGPDPGQVADVVNAVAERYVSVATELKRVKQEELRDILAGQLQYAEASLTEAELSLEGFRVQTITLPSDAPVAAGLESTRAPVLSSFFGMKLERDALERDQLAIQRILAGGGEGLSVDALSAIGAVRESPEFMQALNELASKRANLRALSQQYTAEHPTMQRAAADVADLEQRVVPGYAARLVGELSNRIADLDSRVGSASGELREIPSRAIDEARYRRDVATAERLYTDLRQRYEGARLAAELSVPDVRILDRATRPQNPALDQRIQMVLMGAAMSLGLGLVLAILLDRMDSRLRYVEQVTDDMKVGIIGVVPSMSNQRRMLGTGGAGAQRPQIVEALRSVRLSLMHAYGAAGPMVVAITSPGSGDGKTFMTSNLGLTFADLGLRTLLVDGDTRRGAMHRLFEADRRPGLTDYLSENVEFEQILRHTKYPHLDMIPAGARMLNSPELLSAPRMGDLLARSKAEYDVILIDTPPLGAGVDPLVLGTLAGSMLLVMRTGNTDRAVAQAKLKMLERLPIRLLGTVLNGFDSADSYYYYSYMPGYESADETEKPAGELEPA